VLTEYGMNYELSFAKEDLRLGTDYDSRGFWINRFSNDPIWG